MPPAITLRDLRVGWGTRCVFPGLSLELARGETLCIVGPGASGKSTILHVLEGLVQRASPPAPGAAATTPGDLWWRGEAHAAVTSCVRLRQHGEFVRQPIASLLDEAGLVDPDAWMPASAGERAALRAVYELPLGEAPDPLRRYVSFALVANSDASLLLLDEPLFALHDPWAAAVGAAVQRFAAARARTMVIVTHYLPLARAVADRVMLVIDGQVIEAAATEDFFCRARHPRTRQYLQWGG